MSSAFGTRRFDRSSTTAGLVIGDVVVLVVLLAIGAMRHNENILARPVYFAGTVAPFLIGWIIASLVVGLYSSRARRSVRSSVLFADGTWVIAALIGAGLRATSFFHGESPLTFVLVMLGFGLLFMTVWRLVASVASNAL
ncbi:hypothetical protein BG842_17130 [Haladaptatus sp. W1]|uniref:DUF3054 domain-containing protein n=1 Tax=Haladaptatus sp. W1 TaxID=1897478 RepID=UPI0008498EFC|nr:DUF3054 domain-containing protein [Haladaptatus sp. W1]ODR82773.1 hypothetical protein BG842_17130 [Haladaptatus sp. W1]